MNVFKEYKFFRSVGYGKYMSVKLSFFMLKLRLRK